MSEYSVQVAGAGGDQVLVADGAGEQVLVAGDSGDKVLVAGADEGNSVLVAAADGGQVLVAPDGSDTVQVANSGDTVLIGSKLRSSEEATETPGSMEWNLQFRDRTGVQDFILLENYESEDEFLNNLQKRFSENLIYTYIGQVLISVNPYKPLPIYGEDYVVQYIKKHFFEAPPHVFAIADNSYRSLVDEHRGQCILISGESGSGKTEASKRILEYIAGRTGHLKNVEKVKDKLLQSNPVLEAFGNAKTNKNDNSSRFGKYMEVMFNFEGGPMGGNILNYLLEKSRVVSQSPGERNFHIFYQLLAGADEALLRKLSLSSRPEQYRYTLQANGLSKGTINDAAQFRLVLSALNTMEISSKEQTEIFSIVAAVLHLGNLKFTTSDDGNAKILNDGGTSTVAQLLGVDEDQLQASLTSRTITASGDVINTPLTAELACFARDALAKAVYGKMFDWLIERLNRELQSDKSMQWGNESALGILDIYGFEIFQKNSFEQFCINYCNEKLQQLFIQLTLKQEQEEYLKEGIAWEPVEYFNNEIICDLIEGKFRGIISLLDEECLRPGDATDLTFLYKIDKHLSNHPHYISHEKSDTKTQKIMGRDEFRLIHYAGEVTYNVRGFLEKNNDLLFRDMRNMIVHSSDSILAGYFSRKEINSLRRPETAVTQFKNSLNELMKILMVKEPSYVRCIKPNDHKREGMFDRTLVSHQVKYLGLMENVRVRRAGFAYRRKYDTFLDRYKSLCPETWPRFRGEPRDGVQILVNHLGYTEDEYRMGNTKIFLRLPKTLFKTEDAFQLRKHELATIIQARWRGYRQRQIYLRQRQAAVTMQKWVRRFLAQKESKRRRWAANVIRNFILGFITRNGPPSDINKNFLSVAKIHWLKKLSRSLPTSLLSNSWPPCPASCSQASVELRRLFRKQLARRYRQALTADRKRQFELKVLGESLFKGKKKSYAKSLPEPYVSERLQPDQVPIKQSFVTTGLVNGEQLKYASTVTKYDRRGYKPRERILIVTSTHLNVLDTKKPYRLKHRLPLNKLEFVITNANDDLVLVKIPPELKKDKGDLILSTPYLIEAITLTVDNTRKPEQIVLIDTGSIVHNLSNGKKGGLIEVTTGTQSNIYRAKSGNLLVVSGP